MRNDRFAYVRYDDEASRKCAELTEAAKTFEAALEKCLPAYGREKNLALTKLEETLMWAGKAVRNDMLERHQLQGNLPVEPPR